MKSMADYVCTLEQAKKLKELGCELSVFFHYEIVSDYLVELRLYNGTPLSSYVNDYTAFKKTCCENTYPAFTSQELRELICQEHNEELFYDIVLYEDNFNVDTNEYSFYYTVRQIKDDGSFYDKSESCYDRERITAKNEVQARAELLIHLLEKKQ